MLDHDIGLREASLDVTALEVHLRGDIARLAFSLLLFDANRNVPAFLRPVDISKRRSHKRRAFLHCGDGVHDRRKRLVFDLN